MLTTYIRNHPLIAFVLINYLISWTFLYPCYQLILNAEDDHFPMLALIGLIGAYGPTLAALIVERITGGAQGVKALLRKLLIWKVHIGWYFFVFLLPVLLYFLAVWSTQAFGYELGKMELKEGLSSYFLYILLALPFGPMGEELGWRGFMLPRLLEKFDLWKSSLILGVVWTFWHLASFTFPGAAIPSVFEVTPWTLFLYLLMITSETFLFTFLFLHTKGSVLIAILFHAVFNANSNIVLTIFPQIEEQVDHRELIYMINIALTGLLAFGLLIWRTLKDPPNETAQTN